MGIQGDRFALCLVSVDLVVVVAASIEVAMDVVNLPAGFRTYQMKLAVK
jgi:hypothetical protein